jgi:predicted nuclease of predicted toxin-antitoxin system
MKLFQWAIERHLTVVTFDIDFAERAYWLREPHEGVIRMRLEPQIPAHVFPVLRRFLASWPREKLKNALVVLTENKARVRRFQ